MYYKTSEQQERRAILQIFSNLKTNRKISSTGIRILFILDILLQAPSSKEEILNILSLNPSFQNITKEKIQTDINTLKNAGFEIENLGKTSGYKYKITKSPIKLKLSEEETKALTTIRNTILEIEDWQEILRLYELFETISNFVEEEEIVNELMNFQYFLNVDFKILKDINALTKNSKTALLVYDSPSAGRKEIPIKLEKIKYENSKLYITGKSPNYEETTVLRIDKIVEIKKLLHPLENETKSAGKTTVYKLLNPLNFSPQKNETILNQNENEIEVEIKSDNDFMTVQRLLSFGESLLEIKNEEIKKSYKKTLDEILEMYEEKE